MVFACCSIGRTPNSCPKRLGIAVSIHFGALASVHSVERDPQVAVVNAAGVDRQFILILRDVAEEFPAW